MTPRFDAFCRRKEAAALAAIIPGYVTRESPAPAGFVGLGTAWSRELFDGEFYRSVSPADQTLPITSLVFVQSRNGNTIAPLPSMLGGGETDLHLVYEGLSRVDADAVLSGSTSARARDLVFSVWHPDLVELRLARGHRRHPAQVIVTERGELRFDDGLMFLEPELQVFVMTRTAMVDAIRRRVEGRPWIEVIDAGEPLSPRLGMQALRASGIGVVSCIGGPRTATALLADGLIDDIYLTTSAIDAGEPDTPYYQGPPLTLERVVLKEGRGVETGVRFEHFIVGRRGPHAAAAAVAGAG
jgi:riboflavin biosynthesis pyrimidine reductase